MGVLGDVDPFLYCHGKAYLYVAIFMSYLCAIYVCVLAILGKDTLIINILKCVCNWYEETKKMN